MMTAASRYGPVFDEVVQMVSALIGDEFMLDVDVSPATRFGDDLAVESVEFVALGQMLQQRYGADVDFAAFVADLELDEIIALDLGTVVDHIERCLATTGSPS